MTAACVFTISVVLAALDTCEDVICARPGQKVDEDQWHNE